jgi:DNA-binding FadR family transcriptional regulator
VRGDVDGQGNQLTRHRLSDQIFRRLFTLIATGQLEPGSTLPSVAALSKRYGVSTHSAREAIAGLAARGLVQVAHGRGCFVAPRGQWRLVDSDLIAVLGSEQTLPQLFEVRQTFEVGMASFAAQRRTDDDLTELRQVLTRSRESMSAENQVECDCGFHQAVARATHNPLFLPLLDAIMEPLRHYFKLSQRFSDTAERTYHGHLAIYEGIVAGNAVDAAEAMLAHLRAGREICERLLGEVSASSISTVQEVPSED